ncbi:MAG: hypothetical protein P8Z74_21550, partial [Acidobacteriota bacterium]
MKRTKVEGGPVETVTDFEDRTRGGGYGCVWLPDGRIVFAPGQDNGLFSVPAVGGEPKPLTQPDEERGESGHRLPSVLPDGRTLLYTAVFFTPPPDWDRARIMALRLDTGEKKVLTQDGSDARYAASGHLLFAREGRLMALRFDAERLEILGEPVPVLDGLAHCVQTAGSGRETGASQYAVSRSGTLVYGSGSVYSEFRGEVVWVDRNGREEPLGLDQGRWSSVRFAGDGHRALFVRGGPPSAVWLYDFDRKTLRRQTFEGRTRFATWGPGPDEFTY